MKKRRNLGHVSYYHALAEQTQTGITEEQLPSILEGLGLNHGSQINSGSVYITEAGSRLYLIGTDHTGSSQIYQIRIEGGATHIEVSGSA
jgi:Tol biopolymer transport system component